MFLLANINANVVTCIQLINLQAINVSPLSRLIDHAKLILLRVKIPFLLRLSLRINSEI
jgi:hypothetical protein